MHNEDQGREERLKRVAEIEAEMSNMTISEIEAELKKDELPPDLIEEAESQEVYDSIWDRHDRRVTEIYSASYEVQEEELIEPYFDASFQVIPGVPLIADLGYVPLTSSDIRLSTLKGRLSRFVDLEDYRITVGAHGKKTYWINPDFVGYLTKRLY